MKFIIDRYVLIIIRTIVKKIGPVAQLVECHVRNVKASGSNPDRSIYEIPFEKV